MSSAEVSELQKFRNDDISDTACTLFSTIEYLLPKPDVMEEKRHESYEDFHAIAAISLNNIHAKIGYTLS